MTTFSSPGAGCLDHGARAGTVALFLRTESRSGQQVTAQAPYALGPFVIDGAAASVRVRHTTPGAPTRDVVIDMCLGPATTRCCTRRPPDRSAEWMICPPMVQSSTSPNATGESTA
jgi:hypothetical protein